MGELIRRYIPSWIKHDTCYLYCKPAFPCMLNQLKMLILLKRFLRKKYCKTMQSGSSEVDTKPKKGLISPSFRNTYKTHNPPFFNLAIKVKRLQHQHLKVLRPHRSLNATYSLYCRELYNKSKTKFKFIHFR